MKKQLILFTLAFGLHTSSNGMWLFEDPTTRQLREMNDKLALMGAQLEAQANQEAHRKQQETHRRQLKEQRKREGAQEYMKKMEEWKKLGNLPPLQLSDPVVGHMYLNPDNHKKLSPEEELRAEKYLINHYMHDGFFHNDRDKGIVQFIFLNHYQRKDVTLTPEARQVAENILVTMFKNKETCLTPAEIKLAEGIEKVRKGKELETSDVKTQ